MLRILFFLLFLKISVPSYSQSLWSQLHAAATRLEADPQMKHGILGLHVTDAVTGNTVFSKNAETGFAVASSQKVITAATALDLLGADFKYTTSLTVTSSFANDPINNSGLVIQGTGDPTFGSWRYGETIDTVILNNWVRFLKSYGIKSIKGAIWVFDQNSNASLSSPIPQGYIWQDIGNYYGAGTSLVNWHENQYDVVFRSAAPGTYVSIKKISPPPPELTITNRVLAGKPGSGDNAYIFSAPYAVTAFMYGTIPPNSESFTISGSMPEPGYAFGHALRDALIRNGIAVDSTINTASRVGLVSFDKASASLLTGTVHYSPPLERIIYWFLNKSINLYGEALVKTLSMQENGRFEIEGGIKIIKDFWEKQGIDRSALNISDGSGLSPSNRVSPAALVKVMQYARKRPWFNAFYDGLPEINRIKMKSGTIGGAKSFTGFVKSRSGKEYVFAIVVNNYDGSASQIVQKMYGILNLLK